MKNDNELFESLDKIKQQFDASPYPRISLEKNPKHNFRYLYTHSIVTPYYTRNKKVIETQGRAILDAGCGSGYKALALAEANPGAKIIGIDLSEQSTDLARKRLKYHEHDNAEFYTISIEDLPSLNLKFDYINCDEVLYLLPDPVAGLQAMKSVLKPEGIIRTNLHSALQRAVFYRAQEMCRLMGLMDENPGEMEIGLLREVMGALKDSVNLKTKTWNPKLVDNEEGLLANFLLQGDKGNTIPEVFDYLRATNLEFICMTNWREWQLMPLFKNPEDLPAFLSMSLPETTVEEQLHLFELLQPVHRLIDFWCGHPNQTSSFVPLSEWSRYQWQNARVYLHPLLRTSEFRQRLVSCMTEHVQFNLAHYLPVAQQTIIADTAIAECIFPLLDECKSMPSLVEHWMQLHPVHPVTLDPMTENFALERVKQIVIQLESLDALLLERP